MTIGPAAGQPGAQPGAEPGAQPGAQPVGWARRLLARGRALAAAAAGQPVGQAGQPEGEWHGEPGDDGQAAAEPPVDQQVPRLLQLTAAWSWRLILVAAVIYFAFKLATELRLVVLPLIAATLLTALLQPLAAILRRAGMPRLLATWCTFLAAVIVIAGAVLLMVNRVSADYPTLSAEVTHTAKELEHSLSGPPFHLNGARLQNLVKDLVDFLSKHKAQVAGTVLTGGKLALEVLAGLVLTLFIAFFLLKDGHSIWFWLTKALRPEAKRRARAAGDAAWQALVNYVRGTTVVAAIHAVLIGLALWLLGVPLLVPLIVLVFLASFIPIIGILVVGALAVLVTLATKGWLAAVILVAVFIVENQIEGHLLQPLVVGRIIRLHPLAIIMVLAVGGIIAGIPGAIVAVPTAAVITYAWPYLRGAGTRAPPDG